jgi:plastocyanin
MNNQKIALLAGLAAAIMTGAVIAQPYTAALAAGNYDTPNGTDTTSTDDSELTTLEEEALKAEDTRTSNNATISNQTVADNETWTAAIASEDGTVTIQGTASSPGEQAGPFQIIDLLPPSLDGNVYVGSVSFTATKPILVAPLHTYGVANETLDPEFGELFVFPGIPNGTMIAPGITMPDYATQEDINSDFTLPETYSATVPFEGSGLSVGRLDGEQFLISYTIHATVHPAETINNVESAITNQTEVEGTEATIVSGAAFQNETAYSPNPIEIERGDTVTWVNKDFDPHTVTSGGFMDEDAGDEFDSGYMGPQSSFSFTFEQRGEYEYFCELHPNMIGTVAVD